MSVSRRIGASDVARHSWQGGAPERLGKKRKKGDDSEDDSEGDHDKRGYYTSSSSRSVAKKPYPTPSKDLIEPGVIERVHLENFMCHSVLDWEPHQRINFVTGNNGAGKSSVLQGLVLGLLGETKHIKRFSKVSEFIRKGCSKAIIQVTLSNRGEDSYKPETYGNSITFQRTINELGTSAYLLKDENMREVIRKSKDAKEECKRILDKFKIQLDSPIVILHQDEAKEMLKMESPDKLYKFFEKSTLISQVYEEYSAAQTEYNKAYDRLKEMARSLRDLNQQYRKAKAKLQEIKRAEAMDEELQTTKGEYAWARVHDFRDQITSLEMEVEKVTKKIEQPKAKLMSLHEKLAALKMEKTELEIQIEDESGVYSQQEQEILGLKEEIDRLKLDSKQLNTNINLDSKRKNTLNQELRVLREQLDNVTRKESEEYGRQEKLKLERKLMLKKLEKDKHDCEENIEQEGKAREAVEEKLKEDQDNERGIRKEINSKKEREKLLKQELKDLQNAQGSQQHLAVFGAKIPQLESAIKKYQHEFRVPPLGPVGAHVKLTGEAANSPEVARLVETELTRAQITSYLCDNDEDRRTLSRLCDEVFQGDRGKPRIFTSKFIHSKHKVTKPVLPSSSSRDCALFMNLLQIDNPVVFNHLVDQKSIESVLVCRTQDYAKSLTTKRECVPANVTYAITYDFYRFYPPKGQHSYRSYFMDAVQGSGMLRSTMSNLLKEKAAEMDGLAEHLSGLHEELTQVERSKKSYEAEKKRSAAAIQKLRSEMAKINSSLSKIRSEEDNAVDDADNIRAKISTRAQELDVVEEKIQETLNEREMLNDLIKEKDAQFKENKKELNQLKSATNPLLKQQRETETMISNRTKEILNQEKLVKKLNSDKDALQRKIKENQAEENKYKATALKFSEEELFPERSSKQLDAKIKKLRDKQNKREDVDSGQFLQEFEALHERYTTEKKKIENLENLLQDIARANTERLDNFICIRDIITSTTMRRFNLMVKEFSKQIGSEVVLRIDNSTKELKFNFTNGQGGGSYSSNDVSLLSGGEKSYTQMCLITALWTMMQPPFRCLDEWDVFLDAVNRKTISEELLRFCLRNPDRQFIFISPQVSRLSRDLLFTIHYSNVSNFRVPVISRKSTMLQLKLPKSRSHDTPQQKSDV